MYTHTHVLWVQGLPASGCNLLFLLQVTPSRLYSPLCRGHGCGCGHTCYTLHLECFSDASGVMIKYTYISSFTVNASYGNTQWDIHQHPLSLYIFKHSKSIGNFKSKMVRQKSLDNLIFLQICLLLHVVIFMYISGK